MREEAAVDMWKLIAAVDENWGIGCKNRLLAHIPDDMKQFRERTTGQIVVMGRKTFESLPNQRPLKNRENIVLTTNQEYAPPQKIVLHSVEQLLEYLREYQSDREVYVIGGESVYRQLLPYCDGAYITKVKKRYVCDTYFPNLDEATGWIMVSESTIYTYRELKYTYCIYQRAANNL